MAHFNEKYWLPKSNNLGVYQAKVLKDLSSFKTGVTS